MITLKLTNRYSIGKGTPEEIKRFNDFYDLEEARMKHESKLCDDYNIEEFMRENF